MFQSGEFFEPQKKRELSHKEMVDAEIATAVANIREPLDIVNTLRDLEKRILSASDDTDRHRFSIERAALLQYQKNLESPVPHALRTLGDVIPELSAAKQREHDELGLHQRPDEDRPVARSLRRRQSLPPVHGHSGATMVLPPRDSSSPETFVVEADESVM